MPTFTLNRKGTYVDAGKGADVLNGGQGGDVLLGGPDAADRILGGSGNDSAVKDDKDHYDSIETLLG